MIKTTELIISKDYFTSWPYDQLPAIKVNYYESDRTAYPVSVELTAEQLILCSPQIAILYAEVFAMVDEIKLSIQQNQTA